MMPDRSMQYWAFCANPQYYRIMDAVRECRYDSWNIPRGDVRAGDRAIIWKAKGHDQHRGVVALAQVLTDPERGLDPHRAYWVDPHGIDEPVPRVTVRYLVPPTLPLWQDGPHANMLGSLSVARATGGSVFVIAPDQWQALMEIVGGWPAGDSATESALEQIETYEGRARPGQAFSQAFNPDPAMRRAIEQHAMHHARWHYEAEGWLVSDVSATQSYDLHCVRNGTEQLRVEVKGTTSDGQQVVLTRNEVLHARTYYPHVALYVVSGIQVEMSNDTPVCSGGKARILHPWHIADDALSPLAYTYALESRARQQR